LNSSSNEEEKQLEVFSTISNDENIRSQVVNSDHKKIYSQENDHLPDKHVEEEVITSKTT
jgi:hypothetical protein